MVTAHPAPSSRSCGLTTGSTAESTDFKTPLDPAVKPREDGYIEKPEQLHFMNNGLRRLARLKFPWPIQWLSQGPTDESNVGWALAQHCRQNHENSDRTRRRCWLIGLSLTWINAFADVQTYFDTIKSNPTALYHFFKSMPKGGELHYHYDGSVDAAQLIEEARSGSYCIDPQTLSLTRKREHCQGVDTKLFLRDKAHVDKVIKAWSMHDFVAKQESNTGHFFRAFSKFAPLYEDATASLLAKAIRKAAGQHELYLEIILLHLQDSAKYAALIHGAQTLAEKRQVLLNNQDFQHEIQKQVGTSAFYAKQIQKQLGLVDNSRLKTRRPATSLTIRFQFWVDREAPIDDVFAQALMGFSVAKRSNQVVGVNLLRSEANEVARHNYDAEMHLFDFLHHEYPSVKVSLHAGELVPGLVPWPDLRFHIRDAALIGHANRIGHGVDILHEDDHEKTFNFMAKKQIAVEINLTSNRTLLSIADAKHPLRAYLSHQVPVVLSTDDEGILNTDLTQQYVDAVQKHHLDYQTLKQINRNALTYSFLPGKSLWLQPNHSIIVPACRNLEQATCKQYIQSSEKATLQWRLEKALEHFEKKVGNRLHI